MQIENNSGYTPIQKKHLMVWIANSAEMEKAISSKNIIDPNIEQKVKDKISGLREGVIVHLTEDCFENFSIKPKKGEKISFKGYSGEIYENGEDLYRLFEDRFVVATVNK